MRLGNLRDSLVLIPCLFLALASVLFGFAIGQARGVIGSTTALILALAAGLGFLWRHQQLRTLRMSHEEEMEQALITRRADYIRRFANDIVLLLDSEAQVLDANDRATSAYGYSREEMIGMPVARLRSAATRETFDEEWLSIGSLPSALLETEHQRKDGSVFPVEVSTRAIEVNGKRFRQSIVRDITRRKQYEEARRQSEERYRRLVEGAPLGILVQTGGAFQYLNPCAQRLLGAESAEDLIGRPVFERVDPEFHDIVRARIATLNDQSSAVPQMEQKMVKSCGTTFWAEVSAVPILYDGQPGAIVFFSDISARKQAEEEKAALEKQFLQAQKMESIGRLAGGIAHDFNNLLTVISGYAQVLTKKMDASDPARSGIEEIIGAAQKATALTRQLLTISRRQILEPSVLSLNSVVREMESLLKRLLGDPIVLTLRLAPVERCVKVDAVQIQQVVLNLAVNARDAMPGGGQLTIETLNVPAGRDTADEVCLSVSDTGQGMSAETISHIFEPFFTTKPVGQGTGLGLSTAYAIVTQSEGRITVESQPGEGTTFHVYLPRMAQQAAPEAKPAPAGDSRGRETVLVVEDQPEVRKLVVEILRSYGYSVLVAGNSDEALARIHEHPGVVDLLLSDVLMPGMNGALLAEEVSRIEPRAKILLMSAFTDQAMVPSPGHEWNWIDKPFSPQQLAQRVRSVLGVLKRNGLVLVVDDDQVIRKLIRMMLETSGFEVLLAANGDEATAAVRRERPDVILTDLAMPKKEGLEMIRELRREYTDLKIVVMSGAFGAQHLHTAQRLGADAVLSKPLSRDTLVETISRLVGRSEAGVSGQSA